MVKYQESCENWLDHRRWQAQMSDYSESSSDSDDDEEALGVNKKLGPSRFAIDLQLSR